MKLDASAVASHMLGQVSIWPGGKQESMSSLRNHEGYLLIDNRHSQGVPDEVMVAQGMPVGAGKGLFESATFTCSHCNAVVVLNPKRTRERGYCRKCSQCICDLCTARMALTLECKPMAQIIDEALEAAVKQAEPASSILLGT